MSPWIKVSTKKLSGGFCEEIVGKPLPVSSPQDRRWTADQSPKVPVVSQQ